MDLSRASASARQLGCIPAKCLTEILYRNDFSDLQAEAIIVSDTPTFPRTSLAVFDVIAEAVLGFFEEQKQLGNFWFFDAVKEYQRFIESIVKGPEYYSQGLWDLNLAIEKLMKGEYFLDKRGAKIPRLHNLTELFKLFAPVVQATACTKWMDQEPKYRHDSRHGNSQQNCMDAAFFSASSACGRYGKALERLFTRMVSYEPKGCKKESEPSLRYAQQMANIEQNDPKVLRDALRAGIECWVELLAVEVQT